MPDIAVFCLGHERVFSGREAALSAQHRVMDLALVGVLRSYGVAAVGGFREGLMAIDRLARNAK